MSDIFDNTRPPFWFVISIISLVIGLVGLVFGIYEFSLGYLVIGFISFYLFFRIKRIYLQKEEEDNPLLKL